jgi:hypothetical protein
VSRPSHCVGVDQPTISVRDADLAATKVADDLPRTVHRVPLGIRVRAGPVCILLLHVPATFWVRHDISVSVVSSCHLLMSTGLGLTFRSRPVDASVHSTWAGVSALRLCLRLFVHVGQKALDILMHQAKLPTVAQRGDDFAIPVEQPSRIDRGYVRDLTLRAKPNRMPLRCYLGGSVLVVFGRRQIQHISERVVCPGELEIGRYVDGRNSHIS